MDIYFLGFQKTPRIQLEMNKFININQSWICDPRRRVLHPELKVRVAGPEALHQSIAPS